MPSTAEFGKDLYYTRGYVNIIKVVSPESGIPSFASMVFRRKGSPYTYMQSTGMRDIISSFVPVDIPPESIEPFNKRLRRRVGGHEIAAFVFSPTEIVTGSREKMQQLLRERYDSFAGHPFLRCEIAEFLGAEDLKAQARKDSINAIHKINPSITIKFAEPL